MPLKATWVMVLLLAWQAAGAELSVALTPEAAPDARLLPYRPAGLSLGNAAARAVETVALRAGEGGPTMKYAFTVPPGQTSQLPVLLPAMSPVQRYVVTALDSAGAELGAAVADITWPSSATEPEHSAAAFIDDAFAAFGDAPAGWPARTRRNALLLLSLLALASWGVLLIRRPIIRALALVAAVGIVLALLGFAPAWPETVGQQRYALVLHRPGRAAEIDSFTVLSARRTTAFSLGAPSLPYPVYPNRARAADDDAVVSADDSSIRLTLAPAQVRIIRPAWQEPCGAAPTSLSGTVRAEDDNLAVQTDLAPRRALVVRDDFVWPLAGDHKRDTARLGPPPGPTMPSTTLPAGQAVSIWLVLSNPPHYGLDEQFAPLLRYWRQKHQRAGLTYLLDFAPPGKTTRIDVIELEPA